MLPLACGLFLPASAATPSAANSYVTSGLVSLYDGTKNSQGGHNLNATVWEDLVSGYDLTVVKDSKSYFTNDGYHLNTAKCTFPTQIKDLINGNSFTVELLVKDFSPLATKYNNILTSSNDYLALFRRGETDALEFKYANEAASKRPKLPGAQNTLQNVLISITYTVGGNCTIYYNGVKQSTTASASAMGANDLFIGHTDSTRSFEMLYRSMRFYNRALSEAEVQANAVVDGMMNASNPGYVQIAQPVTNIVGDVAMTREINSTEELSAMMAGEKLPAAAIYTVNDQLKVLDETGSAFADFDEVLSETNYQILPIVIPVDSATVDALTDHLKKINFSDVCVLSDSPALVNLARTKLPTLRGAIDFTEKYKDSTALTETDCNDIRRIVKTNAAATALLPASLATRETVQYLYDGQVTSWVRISDTPDATERYHALLSGAVGVISDDTQGLLAIACEELTQSTMTRTPLNVGHRGIPSQAPENTIEGSLRAFELGANCIEMDIYLTTDGKIVVMHDSTTGRTCNKDLTVESSTWAQLSSVLVNKGFENDPTYKNCRIPLLEDYFKAFQGKDCRLFIEIKSNKTDIVPALKTLINQYDMYAQCSVITFKTSIMTAMREKYPEMSLGCLSDTIALDETDSDLDMKTVMNFIGAYNGTINPSKSVGCGQKALRASLMRGIGIFPYTYKGDISVYKNHFIWGYSALTGNNAESLGPCVLDFASTVASQTIQPGEAVDLSMAINTYNRDAIEPNDMKILFLDGKDCVTMNGHTLTAQKDGTASVVLGYTYSINGTPVSVYTQPIVLTIESEIPEEDVPPTPDSTPNPSNPSDPSDEPQKGAPIGLIVSIAAASVVVIVAAVGGVLVLRKKKH